MASSAIEQVTAALAAASKATLSPSVIQAAGAGKSYQSVAQSTAIAVQDATDYLRNVMTISSVAYGMAMVLIVAGDDDKAKSLIKGATTISTDAATQFKSVGTYAGQVLKGYPSG